MFRECTELGNARYTVVQSEESIMHCIYSYNTLHQIIPKPVHEGKQYKKLGNDALPSFVVSENEH